MYISLSCLLLSLSLLFSYLSYISSGLSLQKLSQRELTPYSLYMRPSFVRAETCSIFNTHVQRICARTHIHIYISVRLYIYIYIYRFIYIYNIIKNSIFLLVHLREESKFAGGAWAPTGKPYARSLNYTTDHAQRQHAAGQNRR